MRDVLDPDVAAALACEGFCADSAVNITTTAFPGYRRAAYRIQLTSGRTIKARAVEDAGSARRLFEARRRLPPAFVAPFALHGRVLLQPWIDGAIVGDAPPSAVIVAAAELLATTHALSAGAAHVMYSPDPRVWRADTLARLRRLTDAAAIDAAAAAAIGRRIERRPRPGRPANPVLCHFDFCGGNMVIDEAGDLRVVDNERVGLGAAGFDLARAWYRWNLAPGDWALFARAYAKACERQAPFEDAEFWRIAVLVQSACLWLNTSPELRADPIARLEALASETVDSTA
jgi:Ser/Thr protein kinase RdoA (MazF antagonist)